MYDIAIIGAGPAGATLARLIGDQYKVLLIEKRRLPDESEGFSYAFKSALMLADALRSSPNGFETRYHEKTGQLRRNILLKNLKSIVIFNPLLRKMVMNIGLQSIKVRSS
jgi:flavin-dependent dehydrogenase